MNIRFNVYYMTKKEAEANTYPYDWHCKLKHKKIRAASEAKAMENFKLKHPDLIPVYAALY